MKRRHSRPFAPDVRRSHRMIRPSEAPSAAPSAARRAGARTWWFTDAPSATSLRIAAVSPVSAAPCIWTGPPSPRERPPPAIKRAWPGHLFVHRFDGLRALWSRGGRSEAAARLNVARQATMAEPTVDGLLSRFAGLLAELGWAPRSAAPADATPVHIDAFCAAIEGCLGTATVRSEVQVPARHGGCPPRCSRRPPRCRHSSPQHRII